MTLIAFHFCGPVNVSLELNQKENDHFIFAC